MLWLHRGPKLNSSDELCKNDGHLSNRCAISDTILRHQTNDGWIFLKSKKNDGSDIQSSFRSRLDFWALHSLSVRSGRQGDSKEEAVEIAILTEIFDKEFTTVHESPRHLLSHNIPVE